MKFILFLMLFTAPPAAGPKVESERAWALQSTSVLEFMTEQACNAAGDAVTTSLNDVNTLTVRGWCFCESTDAGKKCPATTDKTNTVALQRMQPLLPNNVSIGIQSLKPPSLK
jgi:hypothetical protein